MAMVLARLTEEVRFFWLAVSKWRSRSLHHDSGSEGATFDLGHQYLG